MVWQIARLCNVRVSVAIRRGNSRCIVGTARQCPKGTACPRKLHNNGTMSKRRCQWQGLCNMYIVPGIYTHPDSGPSRPPLQERGYLHRSSFSSTVILGSAHRNRNEYELTKALDSQPFSPSWQSSSPGFLSRAVETAFRSTALPGYVPTTAGEGLL